MKLSLLNFIVLALVIISVFLLFSFGYGFGYVYAQWHGWQLQSNILVILILYFILALLLLGFSYAIAQYLRPKLSKYRVAKSFAQLHPYERIGIVWLLQGEKPLPDAVLHNYQASVLLYPLVQSKLLLKQGQFESAQQLLQQYTYNLFEISKILKIEIAKSQQDYTAMRTQLEFLSVQPLSPWLQPMADTYQQQLANLWRDYAVMRPWQIFDVSCDVHFNDVQRQAWLDALWQQFHHASEEEKAQFSTWLNQQLADKTLENWSVANLVGLLKVSNEFNEFDDFSLYTSQQILSKSFIPNNIYIWLAQSFKLLAQQNDEQQQHTLIAMQQQLEIWQNLAITQPSYAFAEWYIQAKLGNVQDTQILLQRFPQHQHIIYLHLQQSLQDRSELLPYLLQLLKLYE
ncbi:MULTISPECIES: hypothetical protein [unclassified Acinetobacter]|uniref:hypothetical protein n=1 Tax=unclassified Acinetobacter TaxID=196816 RepID=UPI0035B8D553